MAGYVGISGLIYGTGAGSGPLGPFSVPANSDNNFSIASPNLPEGTTGVLVPPWAIGMIISPPSSNTSSITILGDPDDVGIGIAPDAASLLVWPGTPPDEIWFKLGGSLPDGSAIQLINF